MPSVLNKLPFAAKVSQPEADVKQNSSTESDGRQLSEGQKEYFAESAVRDENGNLLVMYHGSPKNCIHDSMKAQPAKLRRGMFPPKKITSAMP